MSGFTPGPWWADASHYGTVYIEANAAIDKRLLQEICAVGPTESGREQQLANARLIAAAPELYEALKQAVTSMQDSGYSNSHIAIRAARAALSKAAGEGR